MTRKLVESIQLAILKFGKIGLIIDDNDGAAAVVAGALYGSATLPDWWEVVGTVDDAVVALRTIVECDASYEDSTAFPKLLVIDRMLPLSKVSKQGSTKYEPIEASDEVAKLLEELKAELGTHYNLRDYINVQLGRKETKTLTIFSTSYPASRTEASRSYPWSVGAQEPLRQLRVALAARSTSDRWRELLRFGPAQHPTPPPIRPSAPAALETETLAREGELQTYLGHLQAASERPVPPEVQARARTLARLHDIISSGHDDIAQWVVQDIASVLNWYSSIERVATALVQGHDNFLLLSGAGMSMSVNPLAAGIPKNEVVFANAAWWVLNREVQDRRERGGLDRPRWRTGKRNDLSHGYTGEWLPDGESLTSEKDENLLRAVLRTYKLERDDYPRGDFNDLFQVKGRGADRILNEAMLRFRSGIRMCVSEFDRGIPLQHWLAAHFDWDLIITTNYDSFHERAATSVANRGRDLKRARARMSMGVRDPQQEGAEGQWPERKGPSDLSARLLKVYGSTLDAQNLAFTEEDFRERVGSLPKVVPAALEAVVGGGTLWLVVVGFRMADNVFADAVKETIDKCVEERGIAHVKVVWVVLEAASHYLDCRFDTTEQGPAAVAWRRAFDKMWANTKLPFSFEFIPMSGKALDFFYDLYVAVEEGYQRQHDDRSAHHRA